MRIRNILSLLLLLSAVLSAFAQHATIRRREVPTSTPREVPPRPVQSPSTSLEHASWQRTVYRHVDLTKDVNAPLYYPGRTTSIYGNLSSHILRLVSSGMLTAYQYIDGIEQYDRAHEISWHEVVTRFALDTTDLSLLASEIKAYYIRETWYFDEVKQRYTHQIDALSPILHDIEEYGQVSKPLFWIRYESLASYLADVALAPVVSGGLAHASLDDYLRLGRYEGSIVKTLGASGRSLAESAGTPEVLRRAQDSLDMELRTLDRKLYLPDSLLYTDKPIRRKSTKSPSRKPERKARQSTPTSQSKPNAPAMQGVSVRGRGI